MSENYWRHSSVDTCARKTKTGHLFVITWIKRRTMVTSAYLLERISLLCWKLLSYLCQKPTTRALWHLWSKSFKFLCFLYRTRVDNSIFISKCIFCMKIRKPYEFMELKAVLQAVIWSWSTTEIRQGNKWWQKLWWKEDLKAAEGQEEEEGNVIKMNILYIRYCQGR